MENIRVIIAVKPFVLYKIYSIVRGGACEFANRGKDCERKYFVNCACREMKLISRERATRFP